MALYIAFTRISDYKHHPTDIIAGIIVGIVFALIILLFLVDLFQRPRSFEEKIDDYDLLELQVIKINSMGLHLVAGFRIVIKITEGDFF